MRFRALTLRNWRSFLGEFRIEFAQKDEANVTILIGQNGAGKTAFLNSFTWALFGETTAGFRQADDLFNHAALAAIQPGNVERVEARLEFEHDGAEFDVRRYQEAKRVDGESPAVVGKAVLAATRRKGATEAVSQEEINAILPPGLHPFFFFPAENIGRDIDQNDAASIRASMAGAIDVLLGIERYDRALEVMSMALAKHLKPPRAGARSDQIDSAESEMKRARDEWQRKSDRKKELPSAIQRQESIAEKLSTQLAETEAYRKSVADYKDLREQLSRQQDIIKQATEAQRDIVNENCAVIFGHELFAESARVLDEAHRNGEIPPKVSAGLLTELLDERKKCICGRELGAHERGELEALRSRTVQDFVAEAASHLRGRVPGLAWREQKRRDEEVAAAILVEVRAATEGEAEFRRLKNREQELLSRQPELMTHADPDATMAAWRDATRSVLQLKAELESLSNELPQLERRRDEAEREFQKQLQRSVDAQTVGRAREMLSKVESTLTTIQKAIRAAARRDVERAMNRFYTPLLLKNYRIHLKDDFRYEITDVGTGRAVGASSSEVALATFAFVGALAGLMPVYANLDQLLPRGDDKSVGGLIADASRAYPVVLDAPYSPFGPDYSARFSKELPRLLPQSVVVVREDQLQYVQPMLDARRVGAAYMLRLHTGKEQTKRIRWIGHDVDYVVNTGDEQPPHSALARLPLE
jgi:DNA sulfur modification protein DndD